MGAYAVTFAKNLMLLFVVSSLLGACAHGRPTLGEFALAVPSHTATEPADRLDKDWWKERHDGVLTQIGDVNPQIILIGDSITHGWDSHMDTWTSYFDDYTMINMGFSGDRTQHVLWRFDRGELDGISPKLAMVMIGTNNSNGTDNTAQEIGDGVAAICAELRSRLPETEVLLLSIFPRGKKPSAQREKNAEASRFAKRIARSDKHIHYKSINRAFLDSDGTLPKDIMPDFLHPNDLGYEIWADAIDRKIHRLMSD